MDVQWVAGFPVFEKLSGNVLGAVVDGMSQNAHGPGFDHRRSAAFPGLVDRGFDRAEHGLHVVSILAVSGKSVGSRPLGQVEGRHLLVERGGVGILVVLDDQHQGRFVQSGHVQRFVIWARAGSPVAHHGERHPGLTPVFEGHRHPQAQGEL